MASGDLDSIDECLAWVVRMLDTEFAGADMPKISIEQIMTSTGDSPDWHRIWMASVAGTFDVADATGTIAS